MRRGREAPFLFMTDKISKILNGVKISIIKGLISKRVEKYVKVAEEKINCEHGWRHHKNGYYCTKCKYKIITKKPIEKLTKEQIDMIIFRQLLKGTAFKYEQK